jgi:radical SAM-linked protein
MAPVPAYQEPPKREASRPIYHYWIHYQRRDQARFLGHLELLQVIFRVLQRAGLPVLFSQGFNPFPKISFSPALSVGVESLAEYCIAEADSPLTDLDEWRLRLNHQMPAGLEVSSVVLGPATQSASMEIDYQVTAPHPFDPQVVQGFMAQDAYPILVQRKQKGRTIDARPMVKAMALIDSGAVAITFMVEAAKVGVKPMELVASLFGLGKEDIPQVRLVKMAWRPVQEAK